MQQATPVDTFAILDRLAAKNERPPVKDTVWPTLNDAELRMLVCQMQYTITPMQAELEVLRQGVSTQRCFFSVNPMSTSNKVAALRMPLNKQAAAYLVGMQAEFLFGTVQEIRRILSLRGITDEQLKDNATSNDIVNALLRHKFSLSFVGGLLAPHECERHAKVLAMLVAE